MKISLLILPGTGQRPITLPHNSTLGDLARREPEVGKRSLVLDGREIPRDQWDHVALYDGAEVGALNAVKGA